MDDDGENIFKCTGSNSISSFVFINYYHLLITDIYICIYWASETYLWKIITIIQMKLKLIKVKDIYKSKTLHFL